MPAARKPSAPAPSRRRARPTSSFSSTYPTSIVGGGMVGSLFGKLLAQSGAPPQIVVSRTMTSARRCARYIGGGTSATTDLRRLPADTRLVLITTPHGAVDGVATALAALTHLNFARLFVCHASGMLTAAALAPLAARGARVFSFHPMQSFPRHFRPAALLDSARGITFGVDGTDDALAMARRLARRLGGKTLPVPVNLRTYYHAASVVASTHVAALMSILDTMFAKLVNDGDGRGGGGGGGGSARPGQIRGATSGPHPVGTHHSHHHDFFAVFEPLFRSTLALVKTESPQLALGGAIARGGVDTLIEHLHAVATHSPALVLPFSAMCAQAISLAEQRGVVTTTQIDAMRLAVSEAAHVTIARLPAQP